MIVCCERFQEQMDSDIFESNRDGTWDIYDDVSCHVISGMKHCPFCGLSVYDSPKKNREG